MPECDPDEGDRADGAEHLRRPFRFVFFEIRVRTHVNVAQIECVFQKRHENAAERGGLSEQNAGFRRVARREDQPHAQPRDLKAARQVAEEVQHDICDLAERQAALREGESAPGRLFFAFLLRFVLFPVLFTFKMARTRPKRHAHRAVHRVERHVARHADEFQPCADVQQHKQRQCKQEHHAPEHAQQYDKHSQHGLLLFGPQQRRRIGRRRVGIELELLVFRERGQGRQVIQTLERERLQKPLGRAVEDGSAGDLEPPGLLDELLFRKARERAARVHAAQLVDERARDRLPVGNDGQHLERRRRERRRSARLGDAARRLGVHRPRTELEPVLDAPQHQTAVFKIIEGFERSRRRKDVLPRRFERGAQPVE